MSELDQPIVVRPSDRHSAFHRLIGWEVVEWSDGRAVMKCPVREDFMNRGGGLHGGLVATLMDSAGGYAALGGPPKDPNEIDGRGVTLSLTVNYLGTARDGVLTVTATRTGGGRSVAFVSIRVEDSDGNIIADGVGTFRRFSGAG
ncbi:PaaI family thioesterase [Phreatobacter sp. HK31-P]